MAELSFILDSDETAVLELKLGQYMIGPRGDQGQQGEPGPMGTLTPDDTAKLDKAVSQAGTSAANAAGSATAAANSATNAANSAQHAVDDGQAAADDAKAAARDAEAAAQQAQSNQTGAQAQAEASAASATAAKTSETNSKAWEALAQDWAQKLGGTVDGVGYSAKYWAQAATASATTATTKATAADTAATNSQASATASAGSAANAKTSETNAAASATTAANTVANTVKKTGDTMTGALNLAAGVPIYIGYGTSTPYLVGDAGIPGVGFVDSTHSFWNMQIRDNGVINLRNNLFISAGGADIYGRLNLNQTGSYGEMAMHSTDGTQMFLRGRAAGGGMEWVNNAYNGVVAYMDDGGNVQHNGQGVFGSCTVRTDGNIYMPWAGQWISDTFNGKANNGAQVVWNSGVSELGELNGRSSTAIDASSPWVVIGARAAVGTDINRLWFHVVWQRNQ
jgi:hypothetical protein